MPNSYQTARYGAAQAVICVGRVTCREPSGQIWSPCCAEAIPFSGVVEMILQMEEKLIFPQNHHQPRSFQTKIESRPHPIGPLESEEAMPMEPQTFTTQMGEKATFIIQVQFRQNATWQGTIQWVEQKKTQRFRSTLEMIRLMDEALAEREDQDAPVPIPLGWEVANSKNTQPLIGVE